MLLRDLGIVLAAGALATLLAELLGATNLGTALTFGQIAIVFTVLGLMLRGRGGDPANRSGALPPAPKRRPGVDDPPPPRPRAPRGRH
jgi:hypothetical protein